MSRRRKASGAPGRPSAADEGRSNQGPSASAAAGSGQRPAARSAGRDAPAARGPSLLVQIAILVAIFVVTALIAELAGAANLGVAIGIGQIVFAFALVAMLLRGP